MKTLDSWSPKVLSLLRIVAGLCFMEHGMQKMLGFPPKPPPPPAPPAPVLDAAAAAAAAAKAAAAKAAAAHSLAATLGPASGPIELIGGLLILIGLFSRAAAFICSGQMAFAYFLAHAPRGPFPVNNGGDAAILYCFIFFYLVFSGPGPISIDALMKKKV
jgi:putative oxidoreductase